MGYRNNYPAIFYTQARLLLSKAWGQARMEMPNTAGLRWAAQKNHGCQYNAEKPFGTEGNYMEMDKANPLVRDALFSAMMKVSVELGCAFKTVKEVFSMGEGTIVELDKLAGEAVDVMANGVRIAKGEVVVIDENFGVRITEIIGTPDASGQCGQSEPQQPTPETPEPTKPGETAAEQNADPCNVSVEQGFPIGTKENPADLETEEGENSFVNWLKSQWSCV
jgi:flagellar motor switch protein FliN